MGVQRVSCRGRRSRGVWHVWSWDKWWGVGVKGALAGIFEPMQGGLSLLILDFDQLADI